MNMSHPQHLQDIKVLGNFKKIDKYGRNIKKKTKNRKTV